MRFSLPPTLTVLGTAAVLMLALAAGMAQVTQAAPKKPGVHVMDCTSGYWPGVHTPEMEHCQVLSWSDIHSSSQPDPLRIHTLICYSDGTAACCVGGTCTSVKVGGTKVPPLKLQPGGPLSPGSPIFSR